MIKTKSWYVKCSFDVEFVNHLDYLYNKYGENVFAVHGIANKFTDIAEFHRNFFSKSASSKNTADVSVDGNANVRGRNVSHYNYEYGKPIGKLESFYLLFERVRKEFSLEEAKICLEKVICGELFVNDMALFHMPYCYAFDLRTMLDEGLNFCQDLLNVKITPPKRSESFINLTVQFVSFASNQLAGAVSFPDFFVILDYFYRKEFGEDYSENLTLEDMNDKNSKYNKIKEDFQSLVYSLNWPFRGNQSAFTNLSVLDMGFLESMFSNYIYPDYTRPKLRSCYTISKLFHEYLSSIQGREGIFTFPVMTVACSIDEKNEWMDKDFSKWCAKTSHEKANGNILISPPDSFSSCCRLRNDFKKVAASGFTNSFGAGGLNIGSHRVVGINLPRIAFLEKENPNILNENIDCCWKILYAHRMLIKEYVENGYLPLYTYKWIRLDTQYSTFGFIGAYEYVRNKGFDILKEDGVNCINEVLKNIEDHIQKYQKDYIKDKVICNIEQIPGEAVAVRCAELDTLMNLNPYDDKFLSNQYIPPAHNASIYDRFRIQGEIDKLTSGGAILHINVDDENSLSEDQFLKCMEVARQTGCRYFAFNYCFCECDKGHYSIGKHEKCPICHSKISKIYTRVVGFITPVSAWNSVRKLKDFVSRIYYKSRDIMDDLKNKIS